MAQVIFEGIMKKLKLNLKMTTKDKTENEVHFEAPSELLLSGFKFCYVSPEKLEEQVFALCEKDESFSKRAMSDCLEESLFNYGEEKLLIETERQKLTSNWE